MTQTMTLQIQLPYSEQLKKAIPLFQRMRSMQDAYLLSKVRFSSSWITIIVLLVQDTTVFKIKGLAGC